MAEYNLAPRAVKGVRKDTGSCNDPLESNCSACQQCRVGSRYCLRYLQQLVLAGHWDYLNYWNRTDATLKKYDWGNEDVEKILLHMSTNDFQHVVYNCAVQELDGVDVVDADQYETYYDGAYLSIKLALVEENGEFTGLVTFHTSGS